MLKGHVFYKQYFGNQIFALFINTFLNGKNGISNGYENSMELSYNNTDVTIDTGAICIQGRFLEEDTSTTLDAGTDDNYCKLVLEIDLSQINTELEFNQASFKILKNSIDYPELTQEDIINNPTTGIYQYELARFTTSINGIDNFEDKRTFLDFDSIYAEIEEHIREIDDGSIFELKTETITNENGTAVKFGDGTLICYKNLSFQNVYFQFPTANNSLYFCQSLQLGEYAVEFYDKPVVSITYTSGDLISNSVRNESKTSFGITQPFATSKQTINVNCSLMAVGRWKE